jgi:hypothetical protein
VLFTPSYEGVPDVPSTSSGAAVTVTEGLCVDAVAPSGLSESAAAVCNVPLALEEISTVAMTLPRGELAVNDGEVESVELHVNNVSFVPETTQLQSAGVGAVAGKLSPEGNVTVSVGWW